MLRLLLLFACIAAFSVLTPDSALACDGVAEPDQVAERMTDLPIEIQDSLAEITKGQIAEQGTPLLQTDAPGADDEGKAQVRFARGFRNGDLWIVFLEVSLMRDPRSLGFVRGTGGKFALSAGYFLFGDQCAVRRAIQDGVRNSN